MPSAGSAIVKPKLSECSFGYFIDVLLLNIISKLNPAICEEFSLI